MLVPKAERVLRQFGFVPLGNDRALAVLVGEDGATHAGAFDIGFLASLPNMTVMTPADAGETVRMVRAAAYLPGPVYIRLGRGPTLSTTSARTCGSG